MLRVPVSVVHACELTNNNYICKSLNCAHSLTHLRRDTEILFFSLSLLHKWRPTLQALWQIHAHHKLNRNSRLLAETDKLLPTIEEVKFQIIGAVEQGDGLQFVFLLSVQSVQIQRGEALRHGEIEKSPQTVSPVSIAFLHEIFLTSSNKRVHALLFG